MKLLIGLIYAYITISDVCGSRKYPYPTMEGFYFRPPTPLEWFFEDPPPPPTSPPPRNFLLFFFTLIDSLCKFHIFVKISIEKHAILLQRNCYEQVAHQIYDTGFKFIKENLKDFNKAALLAGWFVDSFS